MTNDQKEEIRKMRQDGKSYSQIIVSLGINENTVKAYCRRNNLGATVNTKPKSEKEIYTSCKHCGKSLTQGTKGKPKKFCCDECRRLWWKANDIEHVKKTYYTLSCAECGNKFESYGNKSRKFCGHACYIKYRFKKEEDLNDTAAVST
ncbi:MULTISPECIES: RNA polymerase subunit sigma-70 [Clostridium]|uniref:RNA polymerase subunit sigma-70 n=1 Tax=Clostridium frigoriphilum TaxID=443253 RepID=A0ABU7UQG5_9CLOT|nr:RNA polymerase subunit sigma-70 [Clostridium sp. DSM 17811]MBU3100654.1 RNA polymerase subunit sigma-70 [Clostridium sp. DSM 17811]